MCTDTSLDFLNFNELASKKNGGKILFATDDWFAEAENLLKDDEPIWKEGIYTSFGKWMDGWETRRKRIPGHDWAIISLKHPCVIKGFCIDTAYFTGNYAPKISIQAAKLDESYDQLFPLRHGKAGTAASTDVMDQVNNLQTDEWTTIVPMSNLGAGYVETRKNYFNCPYNDPWTHLRLNIYPDGGIARIRVYGSIICANNVRDIYEKIDLISRENGGVCEKYSNAHYGHPRNLIIQENGNSMADGWETARRCDRPPILNVDHRGILQIPGNEWAIFRLGNIGLISTIILDTTHFKGNCPDNATIKGKLIPPNQQDNEDWKTILPVTKLYPHKSHVYDLNEMNWCGPVSHIKIIINPDGGLSRLRIWGYVQS
ncbi:hypothetical protein PV325_000789 [Microctonus aethiopoides]|uniref:Allantoate amidinohydrolase n=1 Tax=Microctonus aethiopoides TaxID=144406 RepID=A0AA39KJN1_9HYME|nr:hypothetical protein PV325_000789 [Microctonus aethiopoides]KAK0163975.1 hypothetical protein PV328_002652 [Microctonus aethiopoides]